MFAPGDLIGPYTVRRRLGAGGMGEVYLADHRLIGRRAAIKVLLPALSSKPDIVTRFFNEARATAAIRHPGIVNILDCDVQPNGRAYIVMEYLEGESLGDSLSRVGSFENDMKMVAATLGQIADALEAAHAKGIIHRDLKPDNVFLASMPSSGTPICTKILDFGVAKLAAAANEATKTQTGSLLGTPLYMSPEQCRGAGRVDHRADIYSLGCIGFEMIGGRPPFIREGVGDLMVAHISDPVPDIRSVTPSVPPELAALVMGMLEKNPDSRPRSMLDIVHTIERLVGISAAQFGTLISVPAGFPSSGEQEPAFVPPDPGTTQDPSLRSSRQSVPEIRPGGTRLLSEKPTTFNRTPSERLSPTLPTRRIGLRVAVPLVLMAGALGSYFVFWPRQPPKADYASEPQVGPRDVAPTRVIPAKETETNVPPPRSVVSAEVDSHPAGAEIWFPGDGTSRGRTPRSISLPRGKRGVTVVLRATGYADKTVSLDTSKDSSVRVELERVKTEKTHHSSHRPHTTEHLQYPVMGD